MVDLEQLREGETRLAGDRPRGVPKSDSLLRAVPDDRYDAFRVLGQGGMGIVYWALDTDLNRQVAFKVIRPDVGKTGTPKRSEP